MNAEAGRWPPEKRRWRGDHVDPDTEHDLPSAPGAVRDVHRGVDELCGPAGAAGAAESAGCQAGADGGEAGGGGAELGGGVPPGGAQGSSGAAGQHGATSTVPVLQEQEERGAGEGEGEGAREGASAGGSARGGTGVLSAGGQPGGQPGGGRGGREEDEEWAEAQAPTRPELPQGPCAGRHDDDDDLLHGPGEMRHLLVHC